MSENKITHPLQTAAGSFAAGDGFENTMQEIQSMRQIVAGQQRPANLDSATLDLWEGLAVGLKAELEQRTLSDEYKEIMIIVNGLEKGTYIGMDINLGLAWEVFMRMLKAFREGLSLKEEDRYTAGGSPVWEAFRMFRTKHRAVAKKYENDEEKEMAEIRAMAPGAERNQEMDREKTKIMVRQTITELMRRIALDWITARQ